MIKKMREPLYTQSKNSCAITTSFNILRAKYWIIFNQQQRDKCKSDAEKVWIWNSNNWAIFNRFYNWFTGWIYKEIWLEITVTTYDILWDDFERAYEQWEWFWLWLLYAWRWYREVREDQEITLKEIQNTNKEDYTYYWHNLFYKLWYIVWILQSISYDKKFIKLDKEALKEWVRKWLFWQTARSYRVVDPALDYYLTELNKWTVFNKVELLDKDTYDTLSFAIKLRGTNLIK